MEPTDNLFIVAKVTPKFSSEVVGDEYILSPDFCHPLQSIENFFEKNYDLQMCKACSSDTVSSACLKSSDSDLTCKELCLCVERILYLKWIRQVKVRMDASFFSVLMLELNRSKQFRWNVLSKLYKEYFKRSRNASNSVDRRVLCAFCSRCLWMISITVYLFIPNKNIVDYKWNKKIEILANEKCELENAMVWLSTLGGAFSALGDSYLNCAEKAGDISIRQLHIALRLGDPLTVCRCKIYFAMSLLQRGYYKKTKRIIRDMYNFSTKGEGSKDFRLRNMCIAVWNKLKYVLSQKSIKNT
ncbi:uncharacterized protein LOC129224545 [Uloborus diversus]|uniref:uncharacterized protein LOC129224545 n=1 Tax=Uloborus diversus TaxID=327109 RepID=UPI002409885A|nr:uncharacterized protein LOC129224545 [Uloborus diversus]